MMLKKFSKTFILLAALVMLIGISSCDNAKDNNSTSGNKVESNDNNSKDIYLDNAVVENDSFKLELKSNYCTSQSIIYNT